ncbi:MAG: HNH endonuclease family protein, partial [Pseudomonadales bacterium]
VLGDYLSTLNGDASRWPDDAEFRNACVSAPLYPGRLDTAKTRSLLTELEGGLRLSVKSEEPELPNLSALDIDHILPRSWHAHWPLKDGSVAADSDESDIEVIVRSGGTLTPWQLLIRERHESIPTLGNLTLLNLSVNRAAQHCDFAAKRDKLIANTSLRLNVPLIATSAWDEAAISDRAHALANIALTIWPRNE